MTSVLPATGTAISMGRMGRAYYNGTATTQTSVGNAASVQHLNASIGRGVTTTTSISSVFGGRTAPFTY